MATKPRLVWQGQRITELREERGWSQERLAQEAGCSLRTISRIELGDVGGLMETVAGIAQALDVTLDDLRGEA